jgi:hypothetical protein
VAGDVAVVGVVFAVEVLAEGVDADDLGAAAVGEVDEGRAAAVAEADQQFQVRGDGRAGGVVAGGDVPAAAG